MMLLAEMNNDFLSMFIAKQNMSLKCKTIWQSLHTVTIKRRRTHHVKSNQKATSV